MEWISVDNYLPENEEQVFVLVDGKLNIAEIHVINDYQSAWFEVVDSEELPKLDGVTHWASISLWMKKFNERYKD